MFFSIEKYQKIKSKMSSISRFGAVAVAAASLPALTLASGGGKVELQFSNSDKFYLYVSLALGFLALIAGLFLSKSVMAQSPGNEKMQEVGKAIHEGALAYLRQQMRSMSIFVVLISAGLYALYINTYGSSVATAIAISFIGGVVASYVAGFVGMLVAVNGNMRTAHAALSSYKKSFEIAFHSGAVAGLVTVGMGLIGATLIFLLTGNDSMKVLIGFGFGGSLAALFMRVGGGIFTKAADVGADLVGKVEAGIPEDDPRNPAVIADNVGDNVGDCAGMAADVFESYEVTLIAAIVLGAATASIFDQQTWMRLILFALLAHGVGILASIFGIFTVRGSNDINSDALKPIRKGFVRSALVAVLGTTCVAWFLLGGDSSNPVTTNILTPFQDLKNKETSLITDVQSRLALAKKIENNEVKIEDIQADSKIKEAKLDDDKSREIIQMAMMSDIENLPKSKKLNGFSKIDFSDKNNKVLGYTVLKKVEPVTDKDGKQLPGAKPIFADFKSAYEKSHFEMIEVKITQKAPSAEGAPTAPQSKTVTIMAGPLESTEIDNQIKQLQASGATVEVLNRSPMALYSNNTGEVAVVLEKYIPGAHRAQIRSFNIFKKDIKTMEAKFAEYQKDQSKRIEPLKIAFVQLEQSQVPWWKFPACIVFGIIMAFAIEMLTNYYVGANKRPVQDVANVASAGAAPMMIQGFAYGQEASAYSVFAIVVALIAPLMIFPPNEMGGYILSFYGIALVGLGLLTTTGYILAMDTFGPISDNAQGIFEMSGAAQENPEAARAVQRLDTAGNTTKALTKGFAIATAVVAAVALFHSYVEDAHLIDAGLRLEVPEIFLGLLIGGAAPYLFSAFSINAVGRASFQLINEVRRQFREDPGIMAGTSKPDYARCVALVTTAAQKELIGPGILAIALPVLVAFGFAIGKQTTFIGGQEYNLVGAQALGGFLAGAILSGQLMAVLLTISGGMWDNCKKLIEDGLLGGKGSEAHKASVVVDTVGDPFKDTAGPALNPLIKVMNLVALLLAPVIILPLSNEVLTAITTVALGLMMVAIWWSKRASFSSELATINPNANDASNLKVS